MKRKKRHKYQLSSTWLTLENTAVLEQSEFNTAVVDLAKIGKVNILYAYSLVCFWWVSKVRLRIKVLI